jgi:hypothetical protein
MTKTIGIDRILDTIPIRHKDDLLKGNVCTDWLSLEVDRQIGQILLNDERRRFAKPRRSDIYRACLKRGLQILSTKTVEEIRQLSLSWKDKTRKMPCGFDDADNLELFKLRQQTGIRRDVHLRRLAIKLGCDSIFAGE